MPGTISVSTRYDKARASWIEVADTGPGIKDEDKSRDIRPIFHKKP